MTDSNKPWENENGPTPPAPPAPPAPPVDMDALKAKADELGVQYAANIGPDTLATRVAEAEAAQANPDENKPEPTVVTSPQDINAQKCDEKVSRKEREVPKGSIDWSAQAPLEVINMVSGGISLKAAKAKHAEAMEIRATREANRRGDTEEADFEE